MAIKIVKQGILNKNVPKYRGKCQNCGGQIECDKSDLIANVRPGARITIPYVECPTKGCGQLIYPKEVVMRSSGC